jgi:Mlc titration factor MtfA (ptsG expression regulator)
MPPFDPRVHPDLDRIEWKRALDDALERMDSELALIASELPEGMDPDAPEADRYYAHLPLDPYATADEGEFFAVSSEAFFIAPRRLRDAFPQWYAQLARFFRQDPLQAAG